MPSTSFLERIAFLSRELDVPAGAVIAEAVEVGVQSMYRRCMGEKYAAGQLSHDVALRLLGPREVARLDCVISHADELAEDEIDLICGHA